MSRETRRRMAGTAVLLAVSLAGTAGGQTGAGDGYLFGQPATQLTIRAGYSRPGASSDLFTESFDTFSLQKGNLGAPDVGAELGIRLASQLDLTLGAEYTGRTAPSEYRKFAESGQPIRQTTTFQRVPLTAGLKAYLTPRGRSIGTLAWIPSHVVPWVGAAAGMSWYRFVQAGDFVGPPSSATPPVYPIYSDELKSSGWGFAMQGTAGVDVNLSTRMAVTADARYTRSQATLDRNYFAGYNDLDLSGVSVALGLTFRL
jgi:opacity protein-like surface antigen